MAAESGKCHRWSQSCRLEKVTRHPRLQRCLCCPDEYSSCFVFIRSDIWLGSFSWICGFAKPNTSAATLFMKLEGKGVFAEVYCNKKATSPGLEARGWTVKSRRLCSLAAPELQLFQSISGCCIHDKSVKPASLDVCALLDSGKNNVNLKWGMFISAFFLHHLGSEMQTCSVRLHAPSAITANFDLLHFFKYCHHNSNNSRLQCINRCRSARSAWRCYHFPFQLVPNCLGISPVW